ncbi:MAG: exo-alpha-sialidase [candidate division Zixibacteria bacterium]|nr:exo-alpha-sialidase [candidate division Zixibacteria bacterium]
MQVHVVKTLYCPSPGEGAGSIVAMRYVGSGEKHIAVYGVEREGYDDVHFERTRRFSSDNGCTWSAPEPIPATLVVYKDIVFSEGEGAEFYDPVTGVLVRSFLRQVALDGRYYNFTHLQNSFDTGRTWTAPHPLTYEPAVAFNPNDPVNPDYLASNHGYPGNNIIRHANGTLLYVLAHTRSPHDPDDAKRVWRMGSRCFIGTWDADRHVYDWTPGGLTEISPDRSSRGLMEPEIVELEDGRVLIVWRGSHTPQTPGCKFFSLSEDAGKTLSPPQPWRYSDGTPFYSPSSFHRMIRHSVSGRLYWFGNICDTPPSDNSPRYPLVMAEVDEKAAALKRDTLTVIDDRQSHQSEAFQLSNFSLFEDRKTHRLELYLSGYGEFPGKSVYTAHCYRYELSLL